METEGYMLNAVASGRSHKVNIVFESDLRKKLMDLL